MHLPHPPIFAEKHWKVNGEDRFLRPFEACDLWAYEDALGLRIIGTGKRARGSMQHLSEQIPYTRGLYNQKGLRAICEELKVAKRNRA
jgi:GH24 family phage-related lysozyme (muramidase)